MASGVFSIRQQAQAAGHGAWAGSQTTPYVEYLVVAGGGGGGYYYAGGGGGAGGLLTGMVPVVAGASYTVTVGAGGSAVTSASGNNGDNSVFGSITASGGGGGGGDNGGFTATVNGIAGGSGGGGTMITANVPPRKGAGIVGQGNSSGTASMYGFGLGASGGGAGTVGIDSFGATNPAPISGGGGAGIASAISGTVTVYAGGGGGGNNNSTVTNIPGGVGGGGNGGAYSGTTYGTAGGTNTGGGGGGGGNLGAGASGGSGIVIISYPDNYNAPASFGGANSPTSSTSGSGSINFTGTANQYLRTGVVSSLNMSTGDFTCEFWVYWTNLNALRIWLSTSVTGADMQIGYNATNGLYYANGTGSAVNLNAGTTSSLPANTWVHCVVVRSGTTLSLYSAGTRLATTTTAQTTSFSDLYIGCYQGNAALYNPSGYLTNLRITNTAVYDPSLSTLTVPTAPLTAISGTKLLMNSMSGAYLADSSTNSTTITQGNTGVALPTWNQSSPFATGLGYKNRVYTWTGSGTVTF